MGTSSVAMFVSVFVLCSRHGLGARVASTRVHVHAQQDSGSRVFSDLDDTLKCSLGGVAGMDTNCGNHGEIYPGALNFVLELGRGPREGEVAAPPKVVPLSARPSELRFALGIKASDPLNRAFQEVASSEGIPGWGLDLAGAKYGSLMNALSVFQSRFEAGLSYRKFSGWLSYNASEPTVFLADNGQGDVKAAEMMVARQNDILFQSIDSDGDGMINESEFVSLVTTCFSLSGSAYTPDHARQVFRQEVYRAYSNLRTFRADTGLNNTCMSKDVLLKILRDTPYRKCRDREWRNVQPFMAAAFIHHVQRKGLNSWALETAPGSKRIGTSHDLKHDNIFLFQQYGRAACVAFQNGFISADGYARIMASIYAECFARPASTQRRSCLVLAPEFDMSAGGQMVARPAAECEAPYQFRKQTSDRDRFPKGWVSVPQVLEGLSADSFWAEDGFWFLERKCKNLRNLNTQLGHRLAKAQIMVDGFNNAVNGSGAEGGAVSQGVPYLVNWILSEAGVHCLSRCRTDCASDQQGNPGFFDQPVSDPVTGKVYAWRLENPVVTSGGTKSSQNVISTSRKCYRGVTHVCRMSLVEVITAAK